MKNNTISIIVPVHRNDDGDLFFWMQKRHNSGDDLDGLWEFPGGKIEVGENPKVAAIREMQEEVGHCFKPGDLNLITIETYPKDQKRISLYIYLALMQNMSSLDRDGWLKLNNFDMLDDVKEDIIGHNIEFLKETIEYLTINYAKLSISD